MGGIGLSFVFLYNTEIFPTKVRAFTIGLTSFASRLLCSSIPLILSYLEKKNIHPLSIFFPIGILCLFSGWFLPETKDKVLVD